MDSHFFVQPPSASIAHAVHELWDFQRRGDGEWHSGAPKPFVELVFNLDAPFDWRKNPESRSYRFFEGWLTPLQSGPRQARPDRDIRLVGARLYPAAALRNFGPLPDGDGAPPKRLASADNWFGETRQRLLAATDATQRLGVLDTALSHRLHHLSPPLLEEANCVGVQDLALRFGCDERELRRRFEKDVGVSPKRWLRLARIDRVLRDADFANRAVTIAEIAHRHDFADQAHLAREFRLLIGVSADHLRHGIRKEASIPPHFLG